MPAGKLILVMGGARSGKSRVAERMAAYLGKRVLYVATAEIKDEEMAERVRRHREQRPSGWDTLEEPLQLARALREHGEKYDVILVDCLTLFVTNLMLQSSGEEWEKEVPGAIEDFVRTAREVVAHVIVVSNETGLGVVPESPLARSFRDLSGWANQVVARAADYVYFCVAGCPVDVKKLSRESFADNFWAGFNPFPALRDMEDEK